jgi:hypothetical protein
LAGKWKSVVGSRGEEVKVRWKMGEGKKMTTEEEAWLVS